MQPTLRFSKWLLRAGAILGAVSIWVIGAIICYDVLMRFAGAPTLWALEIATYLMLGAATLASGLAVIQNRHFAVRLFVDALPERSRRIVDLAAGLASAALLGFVTYGFVQIAGLSLRLGMASPTLLQIPLVWPQSILVLGGTLMTLGFLLKTLESARI